MHSMIILNDVVFNGLTGTMIRREQKLEGLCGCPHRAHFFPLMLTLYTVEAMNLWTFPTTFE